MDLSLFGYIFIGVLAVTVILQFWLAQRQLKHVRQHRAEVPEEFRDQISLEAHQKAADYTSARVGFGRLDIIVSTLILLAWTFGGGLQLLDNFWQARGWDTVMTGITVMLSMIVIMSVIDVPLSAWRTFVIEQKFGFNKMTPGLFVSDFIKGILLTLLIGFPLAWAAISIMESTGKLWWIWVWAVWFGFTLLMMWAWPAFIAPLFNKFEPLEDGELKQRIEGLLKRCGFKSNGIFVMDGSRRSAHGNAYFSGLGNNKRIVFYDTLVRQLSVDEIEAVLAHELGHFRLSHIRKRMITMAVISLASLALLGWLSEQTWFFTSLGVTQTSKYMALILFMILAPVFGYLLTPTMSWLSRQHEFQADDYATEQTDANLLITALVKMYRENASTLTPDPVYSGFYDSHPPAPVRISHLKSRISQAV